MVGWVCGDGFTLTYVLVCVALVVFIVAYCFGVGFSVDGFGVYLVWVVGVIVCIV